MLGRDDLGLYALTAQCTHTVCDMSAKGHITDALEIVCGCHGSRFDRYGAVTKGPASLALTHVEITLSADGTIWIDTARPVDSSTRVEV